MNNSEKTCKKMGIYKITNLINGKVYIGQSVNIEYRWQQEKHFQGVNDHLKSAFLKYGLENFCFEILEECQQEELNKKECFYIKNYNSFDRNFGYNETTGGSKGHIQRGRKQSQEVRKKISEAKKGKCFTEEHKKALSEAWKYRDKKFSEETKCKQREGLKKYYSNLSSEVLKKRGEKISEAKKGKCFTEEHKKALSEAAKHRKKPTKAKKVLCLETGKVYNTIAEAAKDTNSCRSKISSVCKGERKTTNGLRFVYVE